MTNLEALVGLNMIGDIGTIRLKKLLEFFGKPENIFKAQVQQLIAIAGIGEKIARQILALEKEKLDKEFAQADKLEVKIITCHDEDYPINLKYIPDPPIVLYVKGKLEKADNFSVAIVGSRRASLYGLSSAEKFAADLASHGFTIISGMARGIDSYAHRGALKSGGRTIAVMGSGFNQIYPAENKELSEKIAYCGAVISEFALNERPLRQNFPRRNRVISGLSLGTLVIEAARNSGALITADFALEQGRDVFALPGKVDSQNSYGTNGLIKQGAKLVSSVEDILEEFNSPIDKSPNKARISKDELKVSLSGEESLLYNLFSGQPILLDEIVEQTQMEVGRISNLLLSLQLKKLIRQLPGKQFKRTIDEEKRLSYC